MKQLSLIVFVCYDAFFVTELAFCLKKLICLEIVYTTGSTETAVMFHVLLKFLDHIILYSRLCIGIYVCRWTYWYYCIYIYIYI